MVSGPGDRLFGPERAEVVVMMKLLSVLVTMMMVLSSMMALTAGQAEGPAVQTPSKVAPFEAQTTFGHSRLSRAYQDLSTWKGTDINVSVSYLIVTDQAFVNAAKPLGQWKTEKGLNTAIVTTQDIYNAYTGQDEPQKIHNYLRDFRDHNPTFKWLLLFGDSQYVPDRHLYTGASYIDWYIQDTTVSDFYYSALDSSWNLDGDNTWGEDGEVDWTPELYVGRIPTISASEATMNVNKILKYEKDPYMGQWMRRALLASALYDIPNVIGNYSTRDKEGWYEWWQDNGKEGIDVVQGQIPSYMTLKTLHDYNVTGLGTPPHYYGGNYTPAKDELSQATFVPEFNKGNSIIVTASHAWVSRPLPAIYPNDWISTGIIDYSGDGVTDPPQYHEFFYYTDASGAYNGDMLPLWYASACLVGNWSQSPGIPENTLELFWRNQFGGVIGLIAASHGDYRGEQNNFSVSDGDTWLLEDYYKEFFGPGEFRPGSSLYLNKIAYRKHLKDDLGYTNEWMSAGFARDSLFVYNLQGDPEVPVWTNLPGDLSATIPANVITGPYSFDITVRDKNTGLPVKDATVGLWGPTQFTSAKTDATGKAKITTNGLTPEKVNVTITAHNYRFMKHYLNITWKPADLTVSTTNITFSKSLVKAGDPLDIKAIVWNMGETAATNVDVKFYIGDPASGGTEIGAQTVQTMDPHTSAQTGITWTALDGVRNICVVMDPLNKITEYNENNNKACKTVEGTAKDLAITADDITFVKAYERQGGTPMVGNNTTADIKIQVENKGSQEVSPVYVRLFDGDPKAGGKRIGFGDTRIESVPAGKAANTTVRWNVTTPGLKEVFAIVDPNDVVKEFDETNNNASKKVFSDLPPALAPLPSIIIDEDTPRPGAFCLFTYTDDPDNLVDELIYRVVSNSNPNVVINLTNACVDVFPKANFNGFTLVTVAVSDGVFEVSRSFKVTVTPVNDPPVITNPVILMVTEGVPLDMTMQVTDPDTGETMTWSDDSPLFQIEPKTGRIRFTPTRNQGGTHTVTITVSDGELEGRATFPLQVVVKNKPPTLVIKEKEWVYYVGQAKKYTFTASDPDNDVVVLTDNFPHADARMPGYMAYTADKSQTGTYNVTISAYDGFVYVNKTVFVTVKEAPTGKIGGLSMMMLGIILLVIILVIAIIAAALMRRARIKEEGATHGKDYDDLYAADEKHKEQAETEKRRQDRERRQAEKETVAAQEGAAAAPAEGQPADGEAPAYTQCPKCGSPKIKKMGEAEWMCMKCGKIFT